MLYLEIGTGLVLIGMALGATVIVALSIHLEERGRLRSRAHDHLSGGVRWVTGLYIRPSAAAHEDQPEAFCLTGGQWPDGPDTGR